MSEWTTFRDNLIGTLNFDKVTEQMKQDFTMWLLETALPLAENSASSFVEQVKAQAKDEQGWCKIRDSIVLPFCVNILIWAVKKSLSETAVERI